jgi:hypothetical protein
MGPSCQGRRGGGAPQQAQRRGGSASCAKASSPGPARPPRLPAFRPVADPAAGAGAGAAGGPGAHNDQGRRGLCGRRPGQRGGLRHPAAHAAEPQRALRQGPAAAQLLPAHPQARAAQVRAGQGGRGEGGRGGCSAVRLRSAAPPAGASILRELGPASAPVAPQGPCRPSRRPVDCQLPAACSQRPAASGRQPAAACCTPHPPTPLPRPNLQRGGHGSGHQRQQQVLPGHRQRAAPQGWVDVGVEVRVWVWRC